MLLDAHAQAVLVRAGELSPVELVERAIAAIERLDPRLNAVVIRRFDKALAEAADAPDGPFRGVPYLLKDLSLVSEGDPTSQGIAGARASGYLADHDSHYVRRMRAAGFVLLGKTNLPELGGSVATTDSAAWGPARNPWDTSRTTGGSSGGAAAAVAAGLVPVADATDAAGSIRVPASHCGLVGLKGSRGRVSVGPGAFADGLWGLAGELCLTRSVRDTAAVLDVVGGPEPGDPHHAPPPARPFAAEVGADPGRLRIGLLTGDPTGAAAVAPACSLAATSAAEALAGLGHDVADGFPPVLARGAFPEAFGPAGAVMAALSLEHWGRRLGRPLTEADVEPGTWAAARFGATVSGLQLAQAVDSLRERAAEIERWWAEDGWDLLLTPTVPAPAPPLDDLGQVNFGLFTSPFNVSGQPAISLPVHTDPGGLPVGVQLVAAYGREDLLLRVAAQLETAMPWAERRPPVHA